MAIHIKPSKKGTFTAAASKRGMSVQSFASKVLGNKEDYSPAMVKKANFAKNAAKWKHAKGGQLGPGDPPDRSNPYDLSKVVLGDTARLNSPLTTAAYLDAARKIKTSIDAGKKKGIPSDKVIEKTLNNLQSNWESGVALAQHNWRGKEPLKQRIAPDVDAFRKTFLKGNISHGGITYAQMLAWKRAKTHPDSLPKQLQQKAHGGYLQYNAPTHAQGGQMVDANGNPTTSKAKAVAEVEKKETKYGNYIFSDQLINPDTGNTIAKDHGKLMKRVKGKDSISMNTRKTYSKYLERVNEAQRMSTGGEIPKYPLGGTYTRPLEKAAVEALPKRGFEFSIYPGAKNFRFNIPSKADPLNPNAPSFRSRMLDLALKGDVYKPVAGPEIPQGQRDLAAMVNQDIRSGLFNTPKLASAFQDPVEKLVAPPPVAPGDLAKSVPGILNKLTGNEIGTALKVGSAMGTLGQILGGANKNKPIMPDYSKSDFTGLGIDNQALKNENIMAMNAANRTAAEGSTTFGQFMNRSRANAASTGRANALASLQGKQYNDQIKIMLGQRQDNIANTEAAEKVRTQVADLQDKAMYQDMIQNFYNKADQYGTEFQKQDYLAQATKNMNENQKKDFMLKFVEIGLKYGDFTWSQDAAKILADPSKYTADQIASLITMRK